MEVSAQLQAPTATLGFSVRSQLLLLMAVVSTAQGQCTLEQVGDGGKKEEGRSREW